MSKIAETDHYVHSLLRQRWSPRAFSGRSMKPGQLLSLLEAARWAASSFNAQPWSFIAALREDEELFGRLFECLRPGNQAWAGKASALLLSVAASVDEDGDPNRYALHDTGMASASLALQATSMGLYAHMMGGFEREKAREEFEVPEEYALGAMIAVGYLGEASDLPAGLRLREVQPRERKPLRDFVFGGSWGEVSQHCAEEEDA